MKEEARPARYVVEMSSKGRDRAQILVPGDHSAGR